MATLTSVVGAEQRGNLPREFEIRKRLSEILHGNVQGALIIAATKILSMIDKSKRDENLDADSLSVLEEAVEVLKNANEEVRNISHELYPAVISLGLCPAMRSLANKLYGSIKIDLNGLEEIDGREQKVNGKMFTEAFRVVIYMCVQEAVNNAIKHGKASEVHIDIGFVFSESWLVVNVGDNGCGFDPKSVKPESFGFAKAQSYTEKFGGFCEIDSREGHGTVMSYNFPTREIFTSSYTE